VVGQEEHLLLLSLLVQVVGVSGFQITTSMNTTTTMTRAAGCIMLLLLLRVCSWGWQVAVDGLVVQDGHG
jgi:hypothetical protein